jgi:hypothetical protein
MLSRLKPHGRKGSVPVVASATPVNPKKLERLDEHVDGDPRGRNFSMFTHSPGRNSFLDRMRHGTEKVFQNANSRFESPTTKRWRKEVEDRMSVKRERNQAELSSRLEV